MSALVLTINHAVLVFVLILVCHTPDEGCSTGNRRGRSVTVGKLGVVIVFVVNEVRLVAMHFVLVVVTEVRKGADSDIDAHSEVDVPRQVETETRSESHRVVHRVTTVLTGFNTHFAGEFHEGFQPVGSDVVHAGTIDQGALSVAGIYKSSMGVPHDRHPKCAEVQCEDQSSTDVHFTRSIRIGHFTVFAQIPGMTGTHTARFRTGREIDVNHGSHSKQACFVTNDIGLQPDVEVARPKCPDTAFATTMQVSMVVVHRERCTEV